MDDGFDAGHGVKEPKSKLYGLPLDGDDTKSF